MFDLFNKDYGTTIGGYTINLFKTTKGEGADFLCIIGKYNRHMFDARDLQCVSVIGDSVYLRAAGDKINLTTKTNVQAAELGGLLCKLLFFNKSGEQATVCDLRKLDDLMNPNAAPKEEPKAKAAKKTTKKKEAKSE